VINVFHFSKEVARTHGVPFKFVVRPGEKFADTKRRLQARIGAADKEFAKFRFALIQVAMFKQPTYIEDGAHAAHPRTCARADAGAPAEDTIYDHKFAPEDCLGLDHVDKSGKARTTDQKAIVIRG
jgi:ubiquitin carboxyl-terminal hydrolase 7